MSYSTASPPSLITQGITSNAKLRIWYYTNTDADTTVDDAGYITDALGLGMKVGDLIFYYRSDTPAFFILLVTAVSSTGSTCGTTHATSS